MKIVIAPEEHIGETFTEVGVGRVATSADIFTHALIKDSEGNIITLGPKTDTQEITIYATIYFQPNFETGITLHITTQNFGNTSGNAFHAAFTGFMQTGMRAIGTQTFQPSLYLNGTLFAKYIGFNTQGTGTLTTNTIRFATTEANTKVKTCYIQSQIGTAIATAFASQSIAVNFETLAQNNSAIWPGYNFDNRQIGIGTGAQTVFNLTWDEARLDKAKAVYVDGVEQTSGVTWAAGSITFDTAPANAAIITADYWVDYIPKDTDHVLDVQFSITFGEGAE